MTDMSDGEATDRWVERGRRWAAPDRWPLPRVVLAASALLLSVAGFVFVDFDLRFLSFGLPLLVAALVGLLAVLASGEAWAHVVTGTLVTSIALMGLFLGDIVDVLPRPWLGSNSRGAYLIVAALALGLPAAVVGALRAGRGRGRPSRATAELGSPHAVYSTAVAGVVAGLLLASGLVGPAFASAGAYDLTPGAVRSLAADDFAFVPAELTVTAGEVTELRVENRDPVWHTFSYARDGTTFRHDLPPNTAIAFLVRLNEPGSVDFWSDMHPENDLVPGGSVLEGTITVVP